MSGARGAVYLVSHGDPYDGAAMSESGETDRDGGVSLWPVVLVSREAINHHSPVVVICPLVDALGLTQLYPSDVVVRAPEAGLTSDCVILTGQLRAIARTQRCESLVS